VADDKFCGGCQQARSRAEFHRSKRTKDGLCAQCKDCAKSRATVWYRANREQGLAARRDWYARNQDARRAAMRVNWAANRGARNAQKAAWHAAHPGVKAQRDRAWQAANPAKVRQYRIVSEHRRRAAGGRGIAAADVRNLIELQGGKCAICAACIRQRKHVDHIRPLSRGGLNDRRNIQILCPPCNHRKWCHDPIEHMQALGFLL
jgi:5-methylcytosine-specific restriction endonuclease McrA